MRKAALLLVLPLAVIALSLGSFGLLLLASERDVPVAEELPSRFPGEVGNPPASGVETAEIAPGSGRAPDRLSPEVSPAASPAPAVVEPQAAPEPTSSVRPASAGSPGSQADGRDTTASESEAPAEAAPEPTAPPAPAESPAASFDPDDNELRFDQMYRSFGPRGLVFSDRTEALADREVEMTGFMAPPLKPDVDFFVLTRVPLALCPFCSSDADWPLDIVFIRMPEGKSIRPTNHQVRVEGMLRIGNAIDEATGFVSLVRIEARKVQVLQ